MFDATRRPGTWASRAQLVWPLGGFQGSITRLTPEVAQAGDL